MATFSSYYSHLLGAALWKVEKPIIGPPLIGSLHKFVGALAGPRVKKGIFITTSSFSKDALSYAPKNETKIVLIDSVQLAQLMIDYNLGVSVQRVYEIKRLDYDYFEET